MAESVDEPNNEKDEAADLTAPSFRKAQQFRDDILRGFDEEKRRVEKTRDVLPDGRPLRERERIFTFSDEQERIIAAKNTLIPADCGCLCDPKSLMVSPSEKTYCPKHGTVCGWCRKTFCNREMIYCHVAQSFFCPGCLAIGRCLGGVKVLRQFLEWMGG
ncbi:MAG: hypothetical protein ABSE73_02075 [Planctomycetota bacterium]